MEVANGTYGILSEGHVDDQGNDDAMLCLPRRCGEGRLAVAAVLRRRRYP